MIYASRAREKSTTLPYDVLLDSDQVHRVFLDELGQPSQLPLNLGLLVLTTTAEAQAPEQARALIDRLDEADSNTNRQAIYRPDHYNHGVSIHSDVPTGG